VVTIILVNWWIYAALAVSLFAVAGAASFLVVRVLQAWRSFKRLRHRLGRELDQLNELSAKAADGAARAGEQAKLTESLGRLRVSLTQLALLRNALDEATSLFGPLVAFFPRR